MDDADDAIVTTESRVAQFIYGGATMTLTVLTEFGSQFSTQFRISICIRGTFHIRLEMHGFY